MGSKTPHGRSMPTAAFLALRSELLLAATMMSCEQALDLADLLHTAIRMRKPGRPLQNLDHLFREEATNLRSVEGAPARHWIVLSDEDGEAVSPSR